MRGLLSIFVGIPLFAASFDVASVKPSAPGAHEGIKIQPGGRFIADGVPLNLLIALAYHLQGFQMSGGDGWINSDHWTIQAIASDARAIQTWSPPDLPEAMASPLRTLLEDRFGLHTHFETHTLPVYRLSVGKNGSRLTVAEPTSPGSILAGPGTFTGARTTMSQIVTLLNRLVDRPVLDKTGLTGYFSFQLRFGDDTGEQSLFTAVQEQLGLKLDAVKEPVEVLVIDSARKPGDN